MNKELIKDVFIALKNNKDRGLELLYNHYHTVLLGVAFKYIKSKDLAEDIVQDVYLKLLNLDPSLFPKKGELSWLYVVTKNQAISYIRKESKYVYFDQLDQIEDEKAIQNFTDTTFDEIIEPLSEVQKEVVSLKIYAGLTHKEISKLLEKPIGTIQWIYNTSIKRLRKVLLATFITSITLLISGASRFVFLYYDLQSQRLRPIQPDIDIAAYYKDGIGIALLTLAIVGLLALTILFRKSDVIPRKFLK
ncbi:RNA polymerase sigma factor [Hujiaoplasma nucleasis]|nr:RNA polymerase sigma factor [Hujiaoplasma nucleasis]